MIMKLIWKFRAFNLLEKGSIYKYFSKSWEINLYKDLYLTNVKNCKYWHFLWGRVLIICWNWTFHFLTHLIFCRWGFRHYSLMADTPTTRAPVLRYLQPRVGVSKSEYLSSDYLPKFSKYSNICKIICVWQSSLH